MSLKSCMSPNIQAGPVYNLKVHKAFIWVSVGWCEFKTVSDDALEVIGHVGLPGLTYDFDVRITNQPGAVLTLIVEEGGKPVTKVDRGATLSGCTLQAKNLLGGLSLGLQAYDATTTEINNSSLLIPSLYIVPQ